MKDDIILSIQSFGRESEYRRASLTILSFFAFTEHLHYKVLLFTDKPEWFQAILAEVPVFFVALTPEKIKQMRGEIDFLHRMKIALIEETFHTYPNAKVIYADSDTFFYKNPVPIMNNISPAVSSMHLWEYKFSEMKNFELPAGATFRAFYELISKNKFYSSEGLPIQVTEEMVSWNAGVMMFHPDHLHFIPDVYALTDQFYPETENHASEQYAFSVMLQKNTEIIPCSKVNYHYWYRIKKQIADQFLSQKMDAVFCTLKLKEKLIFVRSWTKELPAHFESHEWAIRDNAIQAFNENKFKEGYRWTLKALLQKPLGSKVFLKDVLYHLKRHIKG